MATTVDPGQVHPARRVAAVAVTVLAVACSMLSSMVVFAVDGHVPGQEELEPGWRTIVGLVFALGAAIALCWRHRHPLIVTGIAVVPPLVFVADSLAALIALAALAAARRDRVLWMATSVVYTATAVALGYDAKRGPDSMMQTIFGAQPGGDPVDISVFAVLAIALVMTGAPLAFGLLRGTNRDLTRTSRSQRELLAEMTRRDERSRIAREMHDVLGHRLSLLSLQAGRWRSATIRAGRPRLPAVCGARRRRRSTTSGTSSAFSVTARASRRAGCTATARTGHSQR
jgi:signal transduction histidine kinase